MNKAKLKRKISQLDTWEQVRKKLLADPEVKKEYEKLRPKYEAISAVIAARIEKKMTQRQLAQKAKTKQSNISRFESGKVSPSLSFLQKIARALDKQVEIRFKPTV
jgi:DNA-binding XRE family transcriptional regulator